MIPCSTPGLTLSTQNCGDGFADAQIRQDPWLELNSNGHRYTYLPWALIACQFEAHNLTSRTILPGLISHGTRCNLGCLCPISGVWFGPWSSYPLSGRRRFRPPPKKTQTRAILSFETTLKLNALCKLTFDERVELHRVDVEAKIANSTFKIPKNCA